MCESFPSFERLDCAVTAETAYRLLLIYRPPPSKANGLTLTQFLTKFGGYLAAYATYAGNIMIAGDFNIHVDQGSDKLATDFMELMESFGYTQLVNGATHRLGLIV